MYIVTSESNIQHYLELSHSLRTQLPNRMREQRPAGYTCRQKEILTGEIVSTDAVIQGQVSALCKILAQAKAFCFVL